jgi:hypothetical protein
MKLINFKEMNVEVEIGNFHIQDVRKGIGNLLFQQARTIEIDELARKIYASERDVEIPDDLFSEMMTVMEGSQLLYRVKKAIIDNAVNVKQEAE